MGLGKTVSTLTAIQYLMYEDLDITSALVVAPKRVAENVWTDEIEKWEPSETSESFSHIWNSGTAQKSNSTDC